MRAIFILIPSLHPTGPIKGAIALANALAGKREVTLVSLKGGPGADAVLDSRVRQRSLPDYGNGLRRVVAYRDILREAGGRAAVASISSCFSADMVNLLCRDHAITCASVRGNLRRTYQMDYGLLGVPLAMGHLTALRRMDHVVAMTSEMARQVAQYTGRSPKVIGNFVDESPLERYRDTSERHGPLRIVFLGSLVERKKPNLLIEAVAELRARGVDARVDIVGEGPLRDSLAHQIRARGLGGSVTMHGHRPNPYPILAQADVLALPSIAEGLPRASLEALHLGVPCVLRDTDGSAELIQDGINGMVFKRNSEFPAALAAAARYGREARTRISLLPAGCRQQVAAARYLELVETT
jgi:glycosyltransferase involved in cell wall biosynthesis